MSPTPDKRPGLFAILTLLSLLAGCTNIETIRLGDDRPDDLNALLEHRQYERAEQLLNEYPYLDSPGQRTKLHDTIAAYEKSTLLEAQAMEKKDDLIGAIGILDASLVNLPHSTVLNDYRRTLEQARDRRLRDNARKQLLSRAGYIVEQQKIYQEQLNLETPGLGKRWTNTFYQHEAAGLAEQLLICGLESLQEDNLETAESCLRLARSIDETPEVMQALQSLQAKLDDQRSTEQKQAQITRGIQTKKRAMTLKNRTGELLALTGKALDTGDLPGACTTFRKIPAREHGTAPVVAMKNRLEKAIRPRVTELQEQGDRQYRADQVDRAINSWQQALELDPDNAGIQERLERANKVLARLEELKNRQSQ